MKRKETKSINKDKKKNRSLRCLIRCLPFYLLAALACGVSMLARTQPLWVEKLYAQKLYPLFAQPYSRLTGMLPFSLAEVLLIVVCFTALFLFFYFLLFRIKALFRYLCVLLAIVSFLYAQFILTWQLNYSRQPYMEIRGYEKAEANQENLSALCMDLAQEINAIRVNHEQDADGVYLPSYTKKEILHTVPSVYAESASVFPELAGSYGVPKPILLSKPLSYLQITGIFIPHTLEANVNMQELPYAIAFTACHEAAHQRGFAREDEANFIAYAVCVNSMREDFRYAGLLMGFLYAGNALAQADQQAYRDVYETLCAGAQQDIRSYDMEWAKYDGKAAEIEEKVNDTYLKANAQTDGIRSYDRMIELMLARFIRTHSCTRLA